jgi:hypothetical protein
MGFQAATSRPAPGRECTPLELLASCPQEGCTEAKRSFVQKKAVVRAANGRGSPTTSGGWGRKPPGTWTVSRTATVGRPPMGRAACELGSRPRPLQPSAKSELNGHGIDGLRV